jgi:hypothetical protein
LGAGFGVHIIPSDCIFIIGYKMKIDVSVDLDDFFESFNGDNIVAMINDELKEQILKVVKRDPRYKTYINKKAAEMLNSLEL